jgi:hypothetical protein
MDERFKMHRLYSTRLVAVLGAVMTGFLFCYEFFVYQSIRWDLFIIMLVMVMSKITAMVYFRIANLD